MNNRGSTHEMVINEVKYYYSKKIIVDWLRNGELTEEEFKALDKMNATSFNADIKDLL